MGDTLNTLVKAWNEAGTGKLPETPQANYVFPRELRDSDNDWPFVRFSVEKSSPGDSKIERNGADKNKKVAINLPMPPGLTFSDSMQYSTIDLGYLNITAANAVKAAISANGTIGDAAMAGMNSIKDSVISGARSANAMLLASIAARTLRMDDVGDVIDYSARQITAPNTNTTFKGSNIRSFAFTFKLVPKTKADTDAIRGIVKTFRTEAYPAGNLVLMSYPSKWMIEFYNGNGNANPYLPKI